jgi:hypothetical protein
VKLIPQRAERLGVFVFKFKFKLRKPGEGSSLLITDLNSSIKYKGGAKTRRHSALQLAFPEAQEHSQQHKSDQIKILHLYILHD